MSGLYTPGEPETRQLCQLEPSVDCRRPASGSGSQDISHVLASTFKDLYTKDGIGGKDALSNLVKTKTGRSGFYDRCAEAFQQAHSEHSRCIKETDALETQITEASVQAAAKESHTLERIKEEFEYVQDLQDLKDLPAVKSAFHWCVDGDLKKNNLISPQDYLPPQKKHTKPAAAVKPDPARPTFAFSMRVSRAPQDDGHTQIPSPEQPASDVTELSLTLESSSITPNKKKAPSEIKPKANWKDEPSVKDQEEGKKKLHRLKERHNFLRNPRFLPPNAQRGGTSLIRSSRGKVLKTEQRMKETEEQRLNDDDGGDDDAVPVFLAKPSVILFTDYSAGHQYECTLEFKNTTSSSRDIRVIPPTTPYFRIGLGRFPGEGGLVAPGMNCKYTVYFSPDSLADYEDFIVVETQAERVLVVPIEACRPPPVLTLPRVLDCGYCLIGGVKFVEFLCQNVGLSTGTFCIIPKNHWPASNLRSVVRTDFSEQPPFAICPSLFMLQPGEFTVLEVVFFPTAAGKSCQDFTIVCDNCQVKDISIEGEGQLIALQLVSGEEEHHVWGEVHDLTADHFVRFSPCNPHSVQQKKLVIRNSVHLELRFHWQIVKPNLYPLLPGETLDLYRIQFHLATDDVFHVSPPTGVLAPCQDQEFLFSFCPKELKDYHSVCQLVLRDVPQLPPEPRDNVILPHVHSGSKVSDVIVMEIEVKGSTEPLEVLLEPYAVVVPGELLICTTTRRQFKMWNYSKTCVFFQWERMSSSCHKIEVEPSAGKIEENECFDFDLVMTGGKPERVVTSLLCQIEHLQEPVSLALEVSFKGPTVTLSVPSVDFGLLRLGEQRHTTLALTNITQVAASWILEEVHNNQQNNHNSQISVEPCRGVLRPLASCSVNVLFRPHFCQQLETDLELTVENGTGCHLLVQGDVQSPQVCLLNCELVFSELYIGVPTKGAVTLYNQTLLPSNFSWMPHLQGQQASMCTASFEPSSGTLGPNVSTEITVHFTTYTDLALTDVAALCEVEGMKVPLVLAIAASKTKTLSVSYSLPDVCCSPQDQSPSELVLDFGEVILNRPVMKQLLISNHSAIPASFTIEAEYFNCHAVKPSNPPEKRFSYVKKPLHSLQAKKEEEKAHKEFLSNLLAHGKGAAFFIQPNMGMLGPFETLTVHVTAHSDMWGDYTDHLICGVENLQLTIIPMQMTVKGCPLYFQMTGQNQGPSIPFGMHVSGGDTVSRSLRINNPTTFDIRLDWETYNIDQNDRKLVDVLVVYGDAFPLKDADGNELLSGADMEKEEYMSDTDCEEACLYPECTKKKLFSVHIRPHMGNRSDYPYCITPQQIVIPAKGSGTIHVSFTPLTLSESACESICRGFGLAFMSLDSEMAACVPGKVRRVQGLDLEPVRVDLQAVVKPAMLLVQMEEDGGMLEFHASAGDLLREEPDEELYIIQKFQLENPSEMPLHFSLGTHLPFLVLKKPHCGQISTSSSPSTCDSQYLVLRPQQSMQVKVAFHCSASLLDYAQLPEEGVTLIHSASGQRWLRFQQNLLIHYSNSSLQTVPLRADLSLATLHLSSDGIDFGTCYVRQTRTREVDLYSHGAQTDWRSVIEADEGVTHEFRVTPNFGLLGSKELHVTTHNQRLEISFTPSEVREFKAIVVIQSHLAKTLLTLVLRGTGSLDEAFQSDHQM
ncbi:deleted in lung and esophageal cancer protein 1 [Aulostomus maculatus]